jgi:cytochrome c biogenesis protein CcdA
MSLAGALTPLVKVAPRQWILSAVLFTLTGGISASVVGAALGSLGHYVGSAKQAYWLIIPIALVLAAREFRWVHFKLPEPKRQTEKVWAHEFGFLIASGMWGFHIGLGFATYVKYGGFWILAATAFATGSARYGAMLMLVYWLGRAMSVWVMPMIWRSPYVDNMLDGILATRFMYDRSDALALTWSAAMLLIWLLETQPSLTMGHVQ